MTRPGRWLRAGLCFSVMAIAALCSSGNALAASETFTPSGGEEQTLTVPPKTIEIEVVAVGGAGEQGGLCEPGFGGSGGAGGGGAQVSVLLKATGGEKLFVDFGHGGAGGASTSCNGGEGGGATDIRRTASSQPGSLASRLVVAGGGGGGGNGLGAEEGETIGGAGGTAASSGFEAGANGVPHFPEGEGACTEGCEKPPEGGAPGSQSKGGRGGLAGIFKDEAETNPGKGGIEGGPGQGGGGGSAPSKGTGAGGGGGAGYYGGGGGGSSPNVGAGGGAGSSFVTAAAGSSSVTVGTGQQRLEVTYRLADATATSVKCSPSSPLLGQSTTCTATVKDESASGATTPTGNVAFKTSGEGSIEASCALKSASASSSSCPVTYKPSEVTKQPERTDTITATYEGDESHEGSKGTTSVTVFSPTALARGAFVIGNNSATLGHSVTFYEAMQWSLLNSLSGGSAPASFKGFAESSLHPPVCGEKWTSKPGTASAPPATVPEYMEVIAASKITHADTPITGNAPEVVVVKTNSGYSPSTKGTGKVVAVVCGG